MSGILDKKSRIMDYVLTENGRSQIQNNDIRFYYATFSDKSIVYKEKEVDILKKRANISDESLYLPFECNTRVNDDINPELDIKNFLNYSDNTTIQYNQNDFTLNDANIQVDNSLTIGENLLNLNYLESKYPRKPNGITFLDNDDFENNKNFRILNRSSLYDTIEKEEVNIKNIPTIALDKRFSRKNNFKRLIPQSDNVDLYDDEDSDFLYQLGSDEHYVLSNYNKYINFNEEDTPDDSVLKTINNMINNTNLEKKVYEISNYSKNDMYIFDMHEVYTDNGSLNKDKLSFIDLGEIFDKKSRKRKNIQLIGKIINSRDKENKDIDTIFSFNGGDIQENSQNKNFIISSYYSFICMFILVSE